MNMTASDVANAIRSQSLDAPAGRIGQLPTSPIQPCQLPIDTLGRLTDPEQFGDIIVKVGQSRSTAPPSPGVATRSANRATTAAAGSGLPTPGVTGSLQNPTAPAGRTS